MRILRPHLLSLQRVPFFTPRSSPRAQHSVLRVIQRVVQQGFLLCTAHAAGLRTVRRQLSHWRTCLWRCLMQLIAIVQAISLVRPHA